MARQDESPGPTRITLAGHRWELTQSVRDVEPEECGGVTVAPW